MIARLTPLALSRAVPVKCGALLLVLGGCMHCTDGGTTVDAGVRDASGDRSAPLDAAGEATAWDGGPISDWLGWRRLTEVDPTCPVDVPTDASVLPKVSWISCTDGRQKCLQIDTTNWNDHTSTINFGAGYMSEGLSHIILLGRPVSDQNGLNAVFEEDFINVTSWVTQAAFRTSAAGNNCSGNFAISKSYAYFAWQPITNPTPIQVDKRPLGQIGDTTFHFVTTDLNPWTQLGQSQTQQMWASDSTLAFDLEPVHIVGRIDGSSNHVALTSKVALTFPIVVGSDVYAIDQTGTDGWARIMRVNADGSMTEYRAISGHRVSTPASDGVTMYWTECYGTSDPTNNVQPNVEVWSAPYTNDPLTLAATATKVANLGTNCIYNLQQLAQNGMFFATSAGTNYVYRKSDGKLLTFQNGNQRGTWYPLYISQSEYWSIEAQQNGPKGVALTRLQLDPW